MKKPKYDLNSYSPDAGSRIKRLRGIRTQTAMAALAGVTQGQWSKFENGYVPKVDVAQKIAKALETTIEFLCFGIEPKKNPFFDHINDECVVDPNTQFGVTKIIQELTPDQIEILRIAQECPEIHSVVKMMGDLDREGQKEIRKSIQEKKLLQELMRERQGGGIS